MIRIMFVCHGNICRSPMAEFIMKHLVKEKGLSDKFIIASSATSSEEISGGIGNPIYPPARTELKRRGIPFEPRRATKLSILDYGKYDLFVGMDSANMRNMKFILMGDPQEKTRLLMSYTDTPREVSDPWYSDRFDIAFDDIMKGCQGLLDTLIAQDRI